MKLMRKNGGFTLVELIVVIAILAILAGIAVPAYSGYIKKANEAADQQLVAAVNNAFAAACIENGIQQKNVADAVITVSGGKVGSLTLVKATGADLAEMNESFARYFKGNEDSQFKVVNALLFDKASKNFVSNTMSDLYLGMMQSVKESFGTQIGNIQNSAYMQIGSSALVDQVVDVADLATTLIGADSSLTDVVLSDAYIESLAGRLNMTADELSDKIDGMSDDEFNQFMANSTILNVAGTMNDSTKFNETETLNMFATANWGGLTTTINTDPERGLAQVAALYGLYTAYDQEAASQLALDGDMASLVALKEDQGFKEYLAEVNVEGSQASKDYQAYKDALKIVDETANDTDVANDLLNNGYDDPQFKSMLQGILGG